MKVLKFAFSIIHFNRGKGDCWEIDTSATNTYSNTTFHDNNNDNSKTIIMIAVHYYS